MQAARTGGLGPGMSNNVARMNKIHRILALTPYIRADYRKTPEKKMLKRAVRSRNVYENKGNKDKVPDAKSDIYVDMTRLLQKKAPYHSKSCGLSAETTQCYTGRHKWLRILL